MVVLHQVTLDVNKGVYMTNNSTSLVVQELRANLPADVKPEYRNMLSNLQEKMPAVAEATSNFHKSHSQFMGVTLDVTAITPIRSIKHTLAEVDRTRAALQEAYISMRKKEVELKQKSRELENCADDLDREM